MAESKVSIIEIFLRYLSRTRPLMLIFHLFWILCAGSILSVCYVVSFHFTSLVHIYDEAHNIKEFNNNLRISAKIDAEIQDILNKVLAETHSNRSYLFRYHNGLAAVNGIPFFFQTNTHEVISPGTQRLMQFYQRIPASITPFMNQKFAQNECIVLNNIDKSTDIQMLYFYQSRNTKSMIRCPIFMGDGDLWGFVGIDFNNEQNVDKLDKDKTIVIKAAMDLTKIFASLKK
jgi:hypothetical protein